jgi:FixJ family two-component response regulator
MEDDARQRAAANRTCGVRTRLSSLTARERQVLDGVVAGLLNKQIAGRLGIVEKTVKVHRARAVAKLGVRSTAELVRMVQIAAGDQIYGTAQAPSVEQGLHS